MRISIITIIVLIVCSAVYIVGVTIARLYYKAVRTIASMFVVVSRRSAPDSSLCRSAVRYGAGTV